MIKPRSIRTCARKIDERNAELKATKNGFGEQNMPFLRQGRFLFLFRLHMTFD